MGMKIVTFYCDDELIESMNKIFANCKGKFQNKSHLIKQLIVRGIDDYYEKDKTFDKFIEEVFLPNQNKKK